MTREAINELKKYTLGKKNTEKVEISVLQLNRVIKALEQEPRKGHWDIKDNMWWVCSACGCQTRMMKKYNVPNFCPACGAKMEEVEE